MTPKFRSLLETILRPTSSQEAVETALTHARQLVATHGVDVLLKPSSRVRPEIVYKDRIVYRDGKRDVGSQAHINLTIPPDFLHSMIERVWKTASELDVETDVLKCNTNNGKTNGHTNLSIRVVGSKKNVAQFDAMMTEYTKRINQTTGVSSAEQQSTVKDLEPASGSWFGKLFGKRD